MHPYIKAAYGFYVGVIFRMWMKKKRGDRLFITHETFCAVCNVEELNISSYLLILTPDLGLIRVSAVSSFQE